MLVLGRRKGEKIQIGDNIVVTVTQISPTAVQIGIDAPRSLTIIRSELLSNVSREGVTKCDGCSTCSSVSCAR
jgi:carbon storage regulator